MMGLSYGEQLIIWSVRKIVVQQGPDANLLAEYRGAFGLEGDEALRRFCSFFRNLGLAARRPYEIAPPSTLLVMRDEQRILTLIAAAQREDPALFEAHLLWLAAYDHRAALLRITLSFASMLQAHGLELAVPGQEAAASGEALEQGLELAPAWPQRRQAL